MSWVNKKTEREFANFKNRLLELFNDHSGLLAGVDKDSLLTKLAGLEQFIVSKPGSNVSVAFDKLINDFVDEFMMSIKSINILKIDNKFLKDFLFLTQNLTRFSDYCRIIDINEGSYQSSSQAAEGVSARWVAVATANQFDRFKRLIDVFIEKHLSEENQSNFNTVRQVLNLIENFITKIPEKDLNVNFSTFSGIMQVQLTQAIAISTPKAEDKEYLLDVFTLCQEFTKFVNLCQIVDVDPEEKLRNQLKEAKYSKEEIINTPPVPLAPPGLSNHSSSQTINVPKKKEPESSDMKTENHDIESGVVASTPPSYSFFRRACSMLSGAGLVTLGLGYLAASYFDPSFDETMQDFFRENETGVPHQAILPTALFISGITLFSSSFRCCPSRQVVPDNDEKQPLLKA